MIGEEVAKLLWAAQGAAERIARFTAGRSFDDYLAHDMLRAAVERQFEINRRSFGRIRRIEPALSAGIPDLPRIVAFRNVLIHAYATVDPKLGWGVAENHRPALRAAIDGLLGSAPGP